MIYKAARMLMLILCNLLFRINVSGRENADGISDGMILCANHTSNLDPVLIAITMRRQVHYMAKKELSSTRVSKWLFDKLGTIPVDRAKNDIMALKKSVSMVKRGHVLGLFPEGTRVREGQSAQIKPGVGFIAASTGAVVLPVCVRGKPRLFSKIDVIYGQPMRFPKPDEGRFSSEDYVRISAQIMGTISKLHEGSKNEVK